MLIGAYRCLITDKQAAPRLVLEWWEGGSRLFRLEAEKFAPGTITPGEGFLRAHEAHVTLLRGSNSQGFLDIPAPFSGRIGRDYKRLLNCR